MNYGDQSFQNFRIIQNRNPKTRPRTHKNTKQISNRSMSAFKNRIDHVPFANLNSSLSKNRSSLDNLSFKQIKLERIKQVI